MEKKRINYIILALIILVQVGVTLWFCSHKEGFHMDEYFTYSLANNENGTPLNIENGKIYDSTLVAKYLSVETGQQFNYKQVWANQAADVHPPFYYIFIHTLSSFFPERFLPSLGWMLNIAFAVLITIGLYLLYGCFLSNRIYQLMFTAATVLCAGMIESSMLIRMYELAMLMVVLLTLFHVKTYSKSPRMAFYPLLFCLTVAGGLTHYYVIVFLFFLALYYGIHLLLTKRWRDVICYLITMGLSGCSVYMIFPAIIRHLLATSRGTESVANIQDMSDLKDRLDIFGEFINTQMFSGCFWGLLIAVIVLAILRKTERFPTSESNTSVSLSCIFMVGFSVVCFFLFTAKSASYLEERYIFMIYPLAFCTVFTLLLYFLPSLSQQTGYLLVGVLLLSLVFGGYSNFDFPIQYRGETENQAQLEPYRGDLCIVVYERGYRITPSLLQLAGFSHMVFLTPDQLGDLDSYNLTNLDDVIVYIEISCDSNDTLKEITAANPQLDEEQQLFQTQYMQVYHLW